MTIALQAAHGLLDGSTPIPAPAEEPAPREALRAADRGAAVTVGETEVNDAGEGGADRSRAALCHDALEGLPPVAPPIVASDGRYNDGQQDTGQRPHQVGDELTEPWLPAHDGPVSLTGVAAPRTRTVRRSAATLDKTVRRPSKQRPAAVGKAAILDPALAAAVAAAPPRILIVPACGGSGATTTAVLLAAALAPTVPTTLLAAGVDRGALATRADAHGGDVHQLVAWAAASRAHRRPLPDGTANADTGTGLMTLATAGRDGHAGFTQAVACDVFTSLAGHGLAGALDWSSTSMPPKQAGAAATHVLVTAPATSPGLLAAEYTLQALQADLPPSLPLSLLTVDVRGRNPRRAGRAALARLRALQLPITALPYDPVLADEPRIRWAALRPRTRTAVTSVLIQLLPEHHRKDPK
jgi:hypothetical protein